MGKREYIKKNFRSISNLLDTLLLSCILVFSLGKTLGIERNDLSDTLFVMAIIFLAAVIPAGFGFFKGKGKILWGIGMLSVFIMSIVQAGIGSSSEFLREYGDWLLQKPGWREEWIWGFGLMNTAGITLFCFGLQLMFGRYFILKQAVGTGILIFLLSALFLKWKIAHGGVVCCLLFEVSVYIEKKQAEGKADKNQGKMLTFWILPFLGIYLFLMCLMPAPENPYEWTFAKQICRKIGESAVGITESIKGFWKNEDFNFSFVGFSEDGSFGGSLLNSNRTVMTLTPDKALKTNIYLTGKTFDTFENNEWVQTDFSTDMDKRLDTIETLYAVKRQESVYQSDYAQETKLDIRYERFTTNYVFTPLKTYLIKGAGKYEPEGDNLVFSKKRGYGTELSVEYQQLNVDHPEFYVMLENQQDYSYGRKTEEAEANREKLVDIQKKLLSGEERIGEEVFLERSARIKEIYAVKPELSEQAAAYLQEITGEAENDVEKLKLIERALSGLTYTTNPGRLPEDKEFLDYFLLERKEGYCSHFATAFILLARAEGIPARYVQGFCVPAGEKREKGEKITVTSNMAHAWPEAYIAGVGWIPFEPTPGYAEIRYTPWEMRKAVEPGSGKGVIQYITGDWDTTGQEQEQEEETEQEKEEKESLLPFLKLLSVTGIFLLAGVLLFLFIDRWRSRYRYQRLSLEGKLRAILLQNLNILEIMGYGREEGETLNELRERFEKKEEMTLSFIEDYEEAVYGNREVTTQILQIGRKEQEQLFSVLKKKEGRKYFYCRVRLYLSNKR